jgi:hypothetical protein
MTHLPVNPAEPHYAAAAVRDAFLRALEQPDLADAVRLAGTLVTCHNPCPGSVCGDWALPIGSSYGRVARHIIERVATLRRGA